MSTTNGFVERTLANGLRVVVEPMSNVESVAAGFLVRTGGRDEEPQFAGVSHFLEHMCFKGTSKRNWHQITIDFDNMGSTYNAYTSKERTVYYGWVRVPDLERQVELLADMMRSVIPPEEFEMEKKVILEEIAQSGDSIERRVYELMHEKIYAGHSLAWPVLGTTASIEALSRDQLHAYFQDRYHPANIVMIVAGAVEPTDVFDMASRVCGTWMPKQPRPERTPPTTPKRGVTQMQVERFQQQAVGLIYPAPSAVHPDREAGDVLASILGGQNSRFYWNIIQGGIAHEAAAGRLDYCDDGMFIAYGFCEPVRVEELNDAMRREIARVAKEGVTPDEVQRVKNRTRTSLATEAEAPYYRFSQMVQDIDELGRPRTVAERLAAVDAVTPQSIAQYLEAWPLTGDCALVSLGPRDWPPK